MTHFLSPNRMLVAQRDLTPEETPAVRIALRVAAVMFCLTAAGVASLGAFGNLKSELASGNLAPQELAALGP